MINVNLVKRYSEKIRVPFFSLRAMGALTGASPERA